MRLRRVHPGGKHYTTSLIVSVGGTRANSTLWPIDNRPSSKYIVAKRCRLQRFFRWRAIVADFRNAPSNSVA
jgi:hypothetical protein